MGQVVIFEQPLLVTADDSTGVGDDARNGEDPARRDLLPHGRGGIGDVRAFRDQLDLELTGLFGSDGAPRARQDEDIRLLSQED